mgnify:FL=1
MKYILYKMSKQLTPWEIGRSIFDDCGYSLTTLEDADAHNFDWKKYKAIEITPELGTSFIWCQCTIREGASTRYKKWQPSAIGESRPSIISHLAGNSSDLSDSLLHTLTADEVFAGGEWNKLIMNRVVQDIFDSRYIALNIHDNELETSTFATQLKEAIAYTADDTASVPLLTALTDGRTITVAELAAKVINASDIYNTKVAVLLLEQKKIQDQINAVTGIDDTLLLKEDLFGIMVDSGLAISSGREVSGVQRESTDDKYGIQF